MQSIRNLEYQQCRICYDSNNNLQLLTSFVESNPLIADKTYAQLLLEVCNINVMNDKPLGRWPQFVCLGCSRKLKLAYDFIQHTHKINKLLQSIADLLQIRSESDFIEKPALDIPLDIKVEKDDFDSPSNDIKFQYSPVEVDVTKAVSSFQNDDMGSSFTCIDNPSIEYKSNNKINDKNYSETILKEILIPSTIEFVSSDVIVKDDLEKFHSKIINNMGDTSQDDDTDVECIDDNLLCSPESKPSSMPTDFVFNESNEYHSSAAQLNSHKRFRHASEDLETHCAICSQSFARPYNYKRHMKTVHKPKTFKKQHTKQVHKNKKAIKHLNCTEKTKTNNKPDDVTCNICKKKFLNHGRLIRHTRYTHISEEEKITCNFCGHKFARPDNYQTHMKRMHNPDNSVNKFHCSKCDCSYSRRTLLSKHERDMHDST